MKYRKTPLKKIIIPILIGLVFISATQEQKKRKKISEIKRLVKEINADQEYEIIKKHYKGILLSGYFKNGELKKIVADTHSFIGRYITEYFFFSGKLIFIYNYDKAFEINEKTQEPDSSRISRILETRTYIKNDKILEFKFRGNSHHDDEDIDISDAYKFARQLRN
ncbi:hypothetical protein O2K51_03910 [Apibacter raozihei]|uniref:hypothetical protein n=1 Tax=Apibacter TaxID=1778601 RepID=UPI000FE3877D|nr:MULTISPECIES: hypothetical protein [Apibacter]